MVEIIAEKSVYYLGMNNEFRSWLFSYDHALYTDFISQAKRDSGVKRITGIMGDILKKIDRVKLAEYVLRAFPTCANKELLDRIDWFLKGVGESAITTVPKRLVLRGSDRLEVLERLKSEHSMCFHADIGILILVEWLPDKHKNLLDRLPDWAWLHKQLSLDTIVNL